VGAALFVGASVGKGRGDYFFQVASPARRAGERSEVDDSDEKLVTLVKKRGQNVKEVKTLERQEDHWCP